MAPNKRIAWLGSRDQNLFSLQQRELRKTYITKCRESLHSMGKNRTEEKYLAHEARVAVYWKVYQQELEKLGYLIIKDKYLSARETAGRKESLIDYKQQRMQQWELNRKMKRIEQEAEDERRATEARKGHIGGRYRHG